MLEAEPNEEQAKIDTWRLKRALELGYSVVDAETIAGERRLDLHRLERLIRAGASAEQALRIERPLSEA